MQGKEENKQVQNDRLLAALGKITVDKIESK